MPAKSQYLIDPIQAVATGNFIGRWSKGAREFLEKNALTSATFDGAWNEFEFFQDCGSTLRTLEVRNSDRGMSGLRFLRQLRSLAVQFVPKGSFAYEQLSQLNRLEFVWPGAEDGTAAMKLPQLTKLRIDHFSDPGETVANSAISSLTLLSPKVADLESMAGLEKLEEIQIQGASKLKTLAGLPTSLKSIKVEFCKGHIDFHNLALLRELEFLSLIKTQVDVLPEAVYEMKTLRRLGVTGKPVQVDWSALLALPKIEFLAIHCLHAAPNDVLIHALSKKFGKVVGKIVRQGSKKFPLLCVDFVPSPQ